MATFLRLAGAAARASDAGRRWGAFIGLAIGREVEYVRLPALAWENDAEAELRPLGGLLLCRLSCGPHELRCAPGPSTRPADAWHLRVQRVGEVEIEAGELRHVLRPGTWSLNATAQAVRMHQRTPIEQLVLIIPRERVPVDLWPLGLRAAGTQQAEGGAARLLVQMLHECERALDRAPVATHEAVAQALLGLLRAALLERGTPSAPATALSAVHERAMSFLPRITGLRSPAPPAERRAGRRSAARAVPDSASACAACVKTRVARSDRPR